MDVRESKPLAGAPSAEAAGATVLAFWTLRGVSAHRSAVGTPHLFILFLAVVLGVLSAGCDSEVPGIDDGGHLDGSLDGSLDGGLDSGVDGGIDGSVDQGIALSSCPCFAGDGDYCESDANDYANANDCIVPEADGDHVLSCSASDWSIGETCGAGCEAGESAAGASCALPICECFVRVSWCGASAARHGLELDPPCRVPLALAHDEDVLGCDGTRWVVLEECDEGCAEFATGTPDACVSRITPEDPGWSPCPHRSLLRSGLHPEASDRLRCAGVSADSISQTLGYATASAGYHAADGRADGNAYTAAVDLRTRGLSNAQIRALLERLGRNGFAAWYRQPGSDGWPSSEAPHIHAVFAGVVMKSQLRGQVRDFLAGRNGLASHTTYRFWPPPREIKQIVRLLFSRNYTP